MSEAQKAGRLRWKKRPKETGLRSIGAGPRSSVYTDGTTEYASVHAHSFRHTGKRGWYWTSRAGEALINTCNVEGVDEATAKRHAQEHVKAQLAKDPK